MNNILSKIYVTDMTINTLQASTLLELLYTTRRQLMPEEYSIQQLNCMKQYVNDNINCIIEKLKAEYWDELEHIIKYLYVGRSKYTYIQDGTDFTHHIRTKCNNTRDIDNIYDSITLLYSYEHMRQCIENTLSSRTEFIELDFDFIAEHYPPEKQPIRKPKIK